MEDCNDILHPKKHLGLRLSQDTNKNDTGGKEMTHILDLTFVIYIFVGYVVGVGDSIVPTQGSSSIVMRK